MIAHGKKEGRERKGFSSYALLASRHATSKGGKEGRKEGRKEGALSDKIGSALARRKKERKKERKGKVDFDYRDRPDDGCCGYE